MFVGGIVTQCMNVVMVADFLHFLMAIDLASVHEYVLHWLSRVQIFFPRAGCDLVFLKCG